MTINKIKKRLMKQIEYDRKHPKRPSKKYYDAKKLKHFLETHKHSFENVAQAFTYIIKRLNEGEF